MRREIVNILGQLLLVSQLLLTLADFAHTDPLSVGGMPDAIENHDCGTGEVHKALDSCQPCLPCLRVTHSVALPETVLFNAPVAQTPLNRVDCRIRFEVGAASSIPKRGPPFPALV